MTALSIAARDDGAIEAEARAYLLAAINEADLSRFVAPGRGRAWREAVSAAEPIELPSFVVLDAIRLAIEARS